MSVTDSDTSSKSPKEPPYGIQRKTKARLAAVQAVYSHDIAETAKDPAQLLAEALLYHTEDEEGKAVAPDEKFLKKLIFGVFEQQEKIDTLIQQHLGNSWDVTRLGGVMRSLLRVGIFELIENQNLSIKTIINEYLNLSRGFFNEQEVGFVNGILDRIGHKIRSDAGGD